MNDPPVTEKLMTLCRVIAKYNIPDRDIIAAEGSWGVPPRLHLNEERYAIICGGFVGRMPAFNDDPNANAHFCTQIEGVDVVCCCERSKVDAEDEKRRADVNAAIDAVFTPECAPAVVVPDAVLDAVGREMA